MHKIKKIKDYLSIKLRLQLAKISFFRELIGKILLKKLLKYAVRNVKAYKHISSKKISLQDFPILTKNDIRDNFDDFTSNKISRMIVYKSYTGGSTGEPFMFYNQSMTDYHFQKKLWKLLGYVKSDSILAMDGTAINKNLLERDIYWTMKGKKDIPYGRYSLSSLYLSPNNIRIYVEYLIDYKPVFLRGYPSFIYQIATYMDDNDIKMRNILKGIVLTSETVFDYQIDKISKVFNTAVVLQYGHTESIAFAYALPPMYQYKFEPLYGVVEILDDNGNEVSQNEIGEIVVTTLHNYVMPLIRYKTGDYAVKSSKRNEAYAILGRTQDFVVNRKRAKVILTALIFAQHFRALANISKWHIFQYEIGKVDIHIVKAKNFSIIDEEEIIKLFDSKGDIECHIIYVEKISVTKRGKSNLLTQHLKI